MKSNKINLLLVLSKLSYILYIIASLIILIPISIVLVTDITFSSSFSKISIGIGLGLIIIGKTLSLLKKKKGDMHTPMDIGIIIGLLIAFISHILK